MKKKINLAVILGLGLAWTVCGTSFSDNKADSKAIGRVLSLVSRNAVAEAGDRAVIHFKKAGLARVGTRLTVYRVTADLVNTSGDVDDEGRRIVQLGSLVIDKMTSPRRGIGTLVDVMGGIEEGNWVKIEEPKEEADR